MQLLLWNWDHIGSCDEEGAIPLIGDAGPSTSEDVGAVHVLLLLDEVSVGGGVLDGTSDPFGVLGGVVVVDELCVGVAVFGSCNTVVHDVIFGISIDFLVVVACKISGAPLSESPTKIDGVYTEGLSSPKTILSDSEE